MVGRKTGKYSSGSFFYFPALLVLGWVYGASRGTVLNNENVFVNNAGILIYLTYFFIERNSLNVGQLKKLLVNVFLASAIYYLLVLGPDTLLQVKISKLGVRQGGYTVSGIVTASILPLLFYNTIFSTRNRLLIKNKYKNYFLLMTFLFIILLLVASKGVYLSILFTLVILFFFTQGKTKTLISVIGLFLIYLSIKWKYGIDASKFVILSNSDEGNSMRYDMLAATWDELTMLGKGWGAKFQASVLAKRDISGYSSELSYQNLIHKIGLVALLFFAFYGWLFVWIIKLVNNKKDAIRGTGLISLGMVTYLFTAIGNPTLFAPAYVFMTVIVLHLINKQLVLVKNER
ncbi:MAG: hypothetical protein P8H05_01450 [Schleiferiaceae bacterium]|nr:hypothetical protein [Schleiferiaceae bacterium]